MLVQLGEIGDVIDQLVGIDTIDAGNEAHVLCPRQLAMKAAGKADRP